MLWRVGCGGVVLFIVSVCVVYVVCIGRFIFGLGCSFFFVGYYMCIFYFLYAPGSWLYTADCDTGDPGSNAGW